MDRVGRANVEEVRILHEIEVFEVRTGKEDAHACEQTYAPRKKWRPYNDIELVAYESIRVRGRNSDGYTPGVVPCICVLLG